MIVTMPSKSKCSRSVQDLYLQYPYKKNPPVSNTIPLPYVKKSEVSDHKWSITYDEYTAIIYDIFQEIAKKLQDGFDWEIGSNLGIVSLRKARVKSFFDRVASKNKGSVVKRSRNDYENQMIITDWDRKMFPFRNKWLWRFKLVTKLYREIYEKTDIDYTHINKFKDK